MEEVPYYSKFLPNEMEKNTLLSIRPHEMQNRKYFVAWGATQCKKHFNNNYWVQIPPKVEPEMLQVYCNCVG